MSTQLYGDHDTVMDLHQADDPKFAGTDSAAWLLCVKLLPGAERVINGYE